MWKKRWRKKWGFENISAESKKGVNFDCGIIRTWARLPCVHVVEEVSEDRRIDLLDLDFPREGLSHRAL